MKSCGKCFDSFKKSYFGLFISQLFDIGNSTGSLVMEILTLFRTFQRLSAPSEFRTKFSPDCFRMFSWAKDFVDIISKSFRTTPFSNFELFSIYVFIFPLSILTFISTTAFGYRFVFFCIILGGCLALSTGITFFKVDRQIATIITCIGAGAIALYCLVSLCCFCSDRKSKKKVSNENNDDEDEENNNMVNNYNGLGYSFSFSALIFHSLMIPILLKRWKLTKIIAIFLFIILVLLLFGEITFRSFLGDKAINLITKLNDFINNCLSLLIIPSTEVFFKLVDNDFKNNLYPLLGYLANSIVLPLLLILSMVIIQTPSLENKYKKSESYKFNFYYFFELIDTVKQIGYAIAIAFDVIWVCLIIEILWVILVFSIRPFVGISDYSLSAGNSFVLIVSNSILLYSSKNQSKYFSLAVCIIFIIMACIPAILSLYLFFIYDFDTNPDDTDDEKKNQASFKMWTITTYLSPIAWLFYGLNVLSLYK
ncbi:hypothetical protein M9Y10_036757 [Tritrichomonas musculus]|uniref:Uncharacterized protein n=1 Tax=Tritrichomonas musculus TaxID=1915356 RepID=A0ABR2GTQ4_9EUKA